MSALYILYLEAKIENKWRCINGYYKDFEDDEGEFRLQHLILNGSRSFFGDAFDKLCEIGYEVPFTELSIEVQEDQPRQKYICNIYGENSEEIANHLVVPVNTFENAVPKGFQYHGVYHKDQIVAYENGEIEDLYKADVDLSKLTELERKCYEYREWDDPYSWQYQFKIIKEKVENVYRQYRTDTWDWKDREMRIVAFCL